jgi:flagellin-like hook-associated protein FlgL
LTVEEGATVIVNYSNGSIASNGTINNRGTIYAEAGAVTGSAVNANAVKSGMNVISINAGMNVYGMTSSSGIGWGFAGGRLTVAADGDYTIFGGGGNSPCENITITGGTIIAYSHHTTASDSRVSIGGGGRGRPLGTDFSDSGNIYISDNAVVLVHSISSTASGTGSAYPVITQTSAVNTFTIGSNFTLAAGHTLVVPEGRTMTVAPGVIFTVEHGAEILNGGQIINNGTIHNHGTIMNDAGSVANNGVITGNAPTTPPPVQSGPSAHYALGVSIIGDNLNFTLNGTPHSVAGVWDKTNNSQWSLSFDITGYDVGGTPALFDAGYILTGGGVTGFQISPDGKTLTYLLDPLAGSTGNYAVDISISNFNPRKNDPGNPALDFTVNGISSSIAGVWSNTDMDVWTLTFDASAIDADGMGGNVLFDELFIPTGGDALSWAVSGSVVVYTFPAPTDTGTIVRIPGRGLYIQTGANAYDRVMIHIESTSVYGLGLVGTGITNNAKSSEAIGKAGTALSIISSLRAELGAMQNRLEHKQSNVDIAAENLVNSESRIRDTDMAKEAAAFIRGSILVDISNAVLAKANAQGQQVLSLLS